MLFVTYHSVQRPCNLSEIVPDELRTVLPDDVFVETVFSVVGRFYLVVKVVGKQDDKLVIVRLRSNLVRCASS